MGVIVIDEFEAAASILDKSADVLESNGWLQSAASRGGKMCALGAIDDVYRRVQLKQSTPISVLETLLNVKRAAREALHRYLVDSGQLQEHLGKWLDDAARWSTLPPSTAIIMWNDAPTQTAENVISTFRRAALTVRERVE